MERPRIVAVGAGNRMNAYAELCPAEMEVVAVVEPNPVRRRKLAERCSVPAGACHASWEEFLAGETKADAVFICSPDRMHYRQTMDALGKGYDVLLEKPIAQTWEQCLEVSRKARACGRIVGVCHVLRYHPYFRRFRQVVEDRSLGTLVSVNHVEEVGIERMTHAFVRGIWRKEGETNPMILSKACHDLDLLVWLTGRRCLKVGSYGSLSWFRPENAPEGSTLRCTDGCRVERECPYSAVDLYLRRRRWLRHFDLGEGADAGEVILRELKEGPYGRCVYRCDNDVVDHQVASMLFEGGVTVAFAMDAFTRDSARKTHFMFSHGEVYGDEKTLTIRHFRPGVPDECLDFTSSCGECNFHAGADQNLVRDFLHAVKTRDGKGLLTGITTSLESHRIAFEIEKSRKSMP